MELYNNINNQHPTIIDLTGKYTILNSISMTPSELDHFFEEYAPDDLNLLIVITDDKTIRFYHMNYFKKVLILNSQKIDEFYKSYGFLFKAIDFYYPSKIFENLYIGSAYQAANPHIIKDLNIDIVINLTPRAPFATKTTRNYRFDIEDEEGQNIIVVLKKTYGIITNYSQKNILVHCNKGQSRSGSVILYYVCKRLSLSLKEGYDFCKKRHRIIRPNPGFLNQIQDLLR